MFKFSEVEAKSRGISCRTLIAVLAERHKREV
jgi:hypothetical protein